jgi:hypothetical protein
MKIDNRDIFEQIGNLFYAIAAVQHVKPLEIAELKLLISSEWLPRNFETDQSIIPDETHFILFTMDTLAANSVSAQEAFNEFAKFYTVHPEVFSNELKERVLKTAIDIVKIFEANSPLDNVILKALKQLVDSRKVNV